MPQIICTGLCWSGSLADLSCWLQQSELSRGCACTHSKQYLYPEQQGTGKINLKLQQPFALVHCRGFMAWCMLLVNYVMPIRWLTYDDAEKSNQVKCAPEMQPVGSLQAAKHLSHAPTITRPAHARPRYHQICSPLGIDHEFTRVQSHGLCQPRMRLGFGAWGRLVVFV